MRLLIPFFVFVNTYYPFFPNNGNQHILKYLILIIAPLSVHFNAQNYRLFYEIQGVLFVNEVFEEGLRAGKN